MAVNVVTPILKKLSSMIVNEITLVYNFNDELTNLQNTLEMILAVMEDAEKKQASNQEVRLWMEKLKSIAYDAEDILDEYFYEVILWKHENEEQDNSTFFNKVCNLCSNSNISFVCSWNLARQIKEINEKFDKIAKGRNDFGLQIIDVGSSSSSAHTMMMKNRETCSLVPANWKIVGRENDKLKIIKTLLDKDSCLVFAIVGLGGMGKTTMAQQVYNDEDIGKHFQLKIWICVSDQFDVKKLLKNIVNSIGTSTEKYDDASTMNDIVLGLQNALREHKFLLVLDDVWNENPDYWYNFKNPFMVVGVEGSKILVTTRNMDVALIMIDKFPPYELGILNEDDCWFLFKERAFESVAGAVESPKLVEIGKTMVKRCGGLPLAVIFLGSLMRSKTKEEEWKNIRDTEIWHESREGNKSINIRILPSLRLSYDHLPSHLKQCFSYCCLFPNDWKFERETLIRLWMAEGFLIESPGVNAMSMEEIGNEYFNNLLCNFFFQEFERYRDGDILTYKMHDLVHDLARSVVGKNECLIVENAHHIHCISEATFHLNLVNVDEDMLPKVLEALKNAKNLRTVLFNYEMSTWFDILKVVNKNKRLRVLDHSRFDGIRHSSSSIGELKHLRYLNLRKTPKGIGRLRFLQTLNEFNVGNACGIEELEFLNHLTGDLSINHLENVTSRTDACRANLKRKNLRGLALSWSWTTRYDDDDDAINNAEAVLEGLRPHPNLKSLYINNFPGSKLLRWMEDSSCLQNLVELQLYGCEYIDQVAGFGALPSLRDLGLKGLIRLECIGKEFYYSAAAGSSAGEEGGESSSNSTGEASTTTTKTIFPSLKKLTLEFMLSLKEWIVTVPPLSTTRSTNYYCFPLLEEIEIKYCSLLTTITPTTIVFPSLKVLNLTLINGSAAQTLVTNNLNYSLTSLRLYNIPNLITLPRQGLMENNNTLLSLEITDCPKFEGFFPPPPPPNKDEDDEGEEDQEVGVAGGVGEEEEGQVSSTRTSSSSSSLQSLTLFLCPALKFYPNVRSLTSLRELKIRGCKESKSLQDELMTCLSSSSLEHLEYVDIGFHNGIDFHWSKSDQVF